MVADININIMGDDCISELILKGKVSATAYRLQTQNLFERRQPFA